MVTRNIHLSVALALTMISWAAPLWGQSQLPARCYGIVQYDNGQFVGSGKLAKVKSKRTSDSAYAYTYNVNDTTWYRVDYPKTDTVCFFIDGDTAYYFPNNGDSLYRYVQSGKWELANLKVKRGGSQQVTLSFFTAQVTDEGIRLSWRSESECGSYCWRLYRSSLSENSYQRIAEVPAAGHSTRPLEYHYLDRAQGCFIYKLCEVDISGEEALVATISCCNSNVIKPTDFCLDVSRPNPMRSQTVIRYQLPRDADINIKVYNLSGQLVRVLVEGRMDSGIHQVTWDGRDERGKKVSAGVYLYRMTVDGFSDAKKMVVIQ